MADRKPNPAVLASAAALHVTAAVLTWRDLRNRPLGLVRGDRRIWRVASAVNTTGSVAYWLFGRRRTPSGDS